jgi:hypothetical protein
VSTLPNASHIEAEVTMQTTEPSSPPAVMCGVWCAGAAHPQDALNALQHAAEESVPGFAKSWPRPPMPLPGQIPGLAFAQFIICGVRIVPGPAADSGWMAYGTLVAMTTKLQLTPGTTAP